MKSLKCMKLEKKHFLSILIFLSGVVILLWQIRVTFEAFIKGQTTFSVTKRTMDEMVPPAMIFCPMSDFENGIWSEANVSNKDWFFRQFFQLNDDLNISISLWIFDAANFNFRISTLDHLILGQNFYEKSPTFFVEKFLNPLVGMCFALTPNNSIKLTFNDQMHLNARFRNGEKIPPVDIHFMNPEDRYQFLIFDWEHDPLKITLKAGIMRCLKFKKSHWNYISSKRNCSNKEDSLMHSHCILKNQIDCLWKIGPNTGCNCVANTLVTYYEMYPITSSLYACKNNSQYANCLYTMGACLYSKMVKDACQTTCQRVVYEGEDTNLNGGSGMIKSNEVSLLMKFRTMEIEEYDEVWILELYNFIGTVGGSLGLFIGFSYTGFVQQVLDYFIRVK